MFPEPLHREQYGEPCPRDTGPPGDDWCGEALVPIEPEYDSRWFWDPPQAGVPANANARAGLQMTS